MVQLELRVAAAVLMFNGAMSMPMGLTVAMRVMLKARKRIPPEATGFQRTSVE